MSYYIYKHLNSNNEVIYCGKTVNMKRRQMEHKLNSDWRNEIFKTEYVEVTDDLLMDIYEKYYISKHKPKFNVKDVGCQYSRFFISLEELDFKEYIEFKNKSIKSIKESIKKVITKKSKGERLYYEFFLFIDNIFNDYKKYGGSYKSENKILTINGKSEFNVPSGYYRDGSLSVGFYLIESRTWDKENKIIKIEYKLSEIVDDATKVYGECGLENIIKMKLKEYNLID